MRANILGVTVLWVLSGAFMIAGGAIYALWRPTTLRMFSWFAAIGLGGPVEHMRALAAPTAADLPQWVCYSLPQALWLLSGFVAIHAIWRGRHSGWEQLWVLITFAVAVGAEFGQALHVVPGVYDPRDMGTMVIAFLLFQGGIVIANTRNRVNQTRGVS